MIHHCTDTLNEKALTSKLFEELSLLKLNQRLQHAILLVNFKANSEDFKRPLQTKIKHDGQNEVHLKNCIV